MHKCVFHTYDICFHDVQFRGWAVKPPLCLCLFFFFVSYLFCHWTVWSKIVKIWHTGRGSCQDAVVWIWSWLSQRRRYSKQVKMQTGIFHALFELKSWNLLTYSLITRNEFVSRTQNFHSWDVLPFWICEKHLKFDLICTKLSTHNLTPTCPIPSRQKFEKLKKKLKYLKKPTANLSQWKLQRAWLFRKKKVVIL